VNKVEYIGGDPIFLRIMDHPGLIYMALCSPGGSTIRGGGLRAPVASSLVIA